MKFKNIKNEYIFLGLLVVIFYTPCHYFNFLSSYTNFFIFRILCASIILYGCKFSINTSVIISSIVMLLFYKINNICGLKFIEGMELIKNSNINPLFPKLHANLYQRQELDRNLKMRN